MFCDLAALSCRMGSSVSGSSPEISDMAEWRQLKRADGNTKELRVIVVCGRTLMDIDDLEMSSCRCHCGILRVVWKVCMFMSCSVLIFYKA